MEKATRKPRGPRAPKQFTKPDGIPPRGERFKDLTVFAERYVIMRGLDYYMRLFHDGSSEFVRFDTQSGRWFFLNFPPEKVKTCSA